MENKTALDWLIAELIRMGRRNLKLYEFTISQARRMEKEQIEEAFNEGAWIGVNLGDSLGKDFYQKKYGSI
jgi:hypothetical protein